MISGLASPLRIRPDQTLQQYGLQLIAFALDAGYVSTFTDEQLIQCRSALKIAYSGAYADARVYARLVDVERQITGTEQARSVLTVTPAGPAIDRGLIIRKWCQDRIDDGPMAYLDNPRTPAPIAPTGSPIAIPF